MTAKKSKSAPLERWLKQYEQRKQQLAGWLGGQFNSLSRKTQIMILVACFLLVASVCTSMIFGGFQKKTMSETERIVPLKLSDKRKLKGSKDDKKRDSLQQSKPIYQYKKNKHGKDGNNTQD